MRAIHYSPACAHFYFLLTFHPANHVCPNLSIPDRGSVLCSTTQGCRPKSKVGIYSGVNVDRWPGRDLGRHWVTPVGREAESVN